MRSKPVYVYAVLRAAEVPELGQIGIERQGTPSVVRALRVGTVAALVSDADGRRPVVPISRNLGAHHRVIQQALRTATVVPMAFGHVAGGEEEVAAWLRRRESAIVRELHRLEGKVELGLKVRWDVDNIYRYIVDADPVLSDFRARLFRRAFPPSAAEKVELGRMFEERLHAEREAATERLLEALSADALDVDVGATHGEKSVADLSFLVESTAAPAFLERMRALAADWPPEYVFHPSGPWAPFHFVQLPGAARRDGTDDGDLPCAS